MLTIPEKITIFLTDLEGQAIKQDKILVGIRTFATHKNDINLSPFLSDKDGKIEITKKDIQYQADNLISYGIMDYSSLETAKPNIEDTPIIKDDCDDRQTEYRYEIKMKTVGKSKLHNLL